MPRSNTSLQRHALARTEARVLTTAGVTVGLAGVGLVVAGFAVAGVEAVIATIILIAAGRLARRAEREDQYQPRLLKLLDKVSDNDRRRG